MRVEGVSLKAPSPITTDWGVGMTFMLRAATGACKNNENKRMNAICVVCLMVMTVFMFIVKFLFKLLLRFPFILAASETSHAGLKT